MFSWPSSSGNSRCGGAGLLNFWRRAKTGDVWAPLYLNLCLFYHLSQSVQRREITLCPWKWNEELACKGEHRTLRAPPRPLPPLILYLSAGHPYSPSFIHVEPSSHGPAPGMPPRRLLYSSFTNPGVLKFGEHQSHLGGLLKTDPKACPQNL